MHSRKTLLYKIENHLENWDSKKGILLDKGGILNPQNIIWKIVYKHNNYIYYENLQFWRIVLQLLVLALSSTFQNTQKTVYLRRCPRFCEFMSPDPPKPEAVALDGEKPGAIDMMKSLGHHEHVRCSKSLCRYMRRNCFLYLCFANSIRTEGCMILFCVLSSILWYCKKGIQKHGHAEK